MSSDYFRVPNKGGGLLLFIILLVSFILLIISLAVIYLSAAIA
jgi:hypothetical protein